MFVGSWEYFFHRGNAIAVDYGRRRFLFAGDTLFELSCSNLIL